MLSQLGLVGAGWFLGLRLKGHWLLSELNPEIELGRWRRERRGERLAGLRQPGPEVAVNEQLLAQQRHQVRQCPSERALQLEEAKQEHGDERGPDLGFNGVGTGADEGLDLAKLLERREEQFDLPALLVDGGNGGGGKASWRCWSVSV